MPIIQLLENERGERAIVKKVWGFTLYRYASLGGWSLFPIWYPTTLADLTEEKFILMTNPEKKRTKVLKQRVL